MTAIDVLHLPAHDQWDAHQFTELLGGDLTPPGRTFTHHLDRLPAGVEGAVVIVAGRYPEALDRVRAAIAPLAWVLLIVTGDEASVFPWRAVEHPNLRWWIMTPRPDVHAGLDARFVGSGWPPHLRANLDGHDLPRERDWCFAGQVNHERRHRLVDTLRERGGGTLIRTAGFAEGLAPAVYADLLARTRVVPCPSGRETPDSFRLYEALEAGCVPLADAACPAYADRDYWSMVFPEPPPFDLVDDWGDVGKHIDAALDGWAHRANVVQAWWLRHRVRMSGWLAADLDHLAGPRIWLDRTVDEDITVIIPTSPVPSHPSTAVLEETVGTVRGHLPGARIVLSFDGVRAEQEDRRADYDEYTRLALRLCRAWGNVLPIVADEHLHQAGATAAALARVTTPLVLFVEHDTPLTPDCPVEWDGIAAAILAGDVNLVRLHHEAHVLDEHRHLMIGPGPVEMHGVRLWPTAQFSARPHLASTAYYRSMLARWFPAGARTMIEDRMYGVVETAWREDRHTGWALHRIATYCPPGDNIKRSYHLDARGDAPKYEMEFGP